MLIANSARFSLPKIQPVPTNKNSILSLERGAKGSVSRLRVDARKQFGRSVSSLDRDWDSLVCQAAVADPPSVVDEKGEAEDELEAKAILRFCRGSPHKMRRVIDTIRGRSYEEALIILEYLPYRATEPIQKLLLSAAANAKQNFGMRKTRLYVSECFVDEAPTFKRFRCRARGRGTQILKRNSHITIKVKERAPPEGEPKEAEPVEEKST